MIVFVGVVVFVGVCVGVLVIVGVCVGVGVEVNVAAGVDGGVISGVEHRFPQVNNPSGTSITVSPAEYITLPSSAQKYSAELPKGLFKIVCGFPSQSVYEVTFKPEGSPSLLRE